MVLDDILVLANKYAQGLKNVLERREKWLIQFPIVINRLQEIANYLNEHSNYKQPFYVDKLLAFNEEIDGTCLEMPSITFRAGEMPMHVTFTNKEGEVKEYKEEGFKITFSPTITGQVIIMIFPHYNNLDENPPQFKTMAVMNDPSQLTNDVIDEIIKRAIEAAYYSSFTGVAETVQNLEQQKHQNIANPIGFKRYETSEKQQIN